MTMTGRTGSRYVPDADSSRSNGSLWVWAQDDLEKAALVDGAGNPELDDEIESEWEIILTHDAGVGGSKSETDPLLAASVSSVVSEEE